MSHDKTVALWVSQPVLPDQTVLLFEATDSRGAWSFNVQRSPFLRRGVWQHLVTVGPESSTCNPYAAAL